MLWTITELLASMSVLIPVPCIYAHPALGLSSSPGACGLAPATTNPAVLGTATTKYTPKGWQTDGKW